MGLFDNLFRREPEKPVVYQWAEENIRHLTVKTTDKQGIFDGHEYVSPVFRHRVLGSSVVH